MDGTLKDEQEPASKFRKAALDHIATSEQLDQLIRIIGPKSWIALLVLWGILIAVILWGIFGSIPKRVQGTGLILAQESSLFTAVAPEGISHVAQINVKIGDAVKKGQVVVTLENSELAKEVKNTEDYLRQLNNDFDHLQETANDEIATRTKELDDQNKLLQNELEDTTRKFNRISELLKVRQEALRKGLETKQEVLETYKDFYNTQQEMENTKNSLEQNKIQKANFLDQWHERLREFSLKITDEQHKLENLKTQWVVSGQIVSPINGFVTQIQKGIGDSVKAGDPVISIANPGANMVAEIYMSPKDGKRVKKDMNSLVSPTIIQKEEYGSIKGKVETVSEYPVTEDTMMAVLKNQDLVKQFSKDGAPIAIRILLIKDPRTQSGFAWSSSKGPNQKITPGTLATAEIEVKKERPVSLIIPAFRKLLGVE